MVRTDVQWFSFIIMKSDDRRNKIHILFSIAFCKIIRDDCTPYLNNSEDDVGDHLDRMSHNVDTTKRCSRIFV